MEQIKSVDCVSREVGFVEKASTPLRDEVLPILDACLYPGAALLVREQRRWRAYVTDAVVEPNIERDVLAMQRADKPVLLKRLFELGAEYSGQILSYTKMLGQLQDAGSTTTLTRYLDLLANAGLIAGLPQPPRRWFRHQRRIQAGRGG